MPLGKVYPVQLDPSRATAATASSLEKVVGEPAGSLVAKLAAAQKVGSKAPIAVITYRQADFDARRARLDALKGVIYPAREQPLARTRSFGQPLLGSYGQVSAELIEKGEGRYAAGDFAGVSGLQAQQYDSVLGGTPGISIASSGKPATPLFEKASTPGEDVQLTLALGAGGRREGARRNRRGAECPRRHRHPDRRRHRRGQLAGLRFRPRHHRALPARLDLQGREHLRPPLQGAVTPSTPVSCPKTYVVDGRMIRNYESGSPTRFADDFANSCNTAFVQLAEKLGDGDLAEGAGLGIGAGWEKTVGVNGAFAGSIPENTGATDKAAATIGQGRNLTSPSLSQ